MKKGQIISLDLMSALIIFLVIIGVLFFIIVNIPDQQEEQEFEYELLYVYDNIEANFASTNPFYAEYRVDKTELDGLPASLSSGNELDEYVLDRAGTSDTRGIGLYDEAYDSCIYFTAHPDDPDTNIEGIITLGSGDLAIGYLEELGESCHQQLQTGESLCEGYRQTMATFRPVLYDTGSEETNRIVQMNVVVCRK